MKKATPKDGLPTLAGISGSDRSVAVWYAQSPLSEVSMRKIDSFEDQMRGVITYELDNGQRVVLDERAARKYGAATLLREYGCDIDDTLLPVMQSGQMVGRLPASFDPATATSKSTLYDFRQGDFTRDGDKWIASKMLGYGDLMAVPGFLPA
jgi:hypothetical protein